jgi:hypothetical protein
MMSSYWEEAAYGEPPLADLERLDATHVFGWLQERFAVRGSKIDWSLALGKHSHWKINDDEQMVELVGREIGLRLQSGAVVEHVGDGLSPFGVRFGGTDAPGVVGALLEIPEHHYFVAEDRSWIVVTTTEGDLDVLEMAAR